MGGSIVQSELISLVDIHKDLTMEAIFIEVGWIEYYDHLQGFHKDITYEFSHNLMGEVTMV